MPASPLKAIHFPRKPGRKIFLSEHPVFSMNQLEFPLYSMYEIKKYPGPIHVQPAPAEGADPDYNLL
jgi:hypothetical protein